MIEPVLFYFCHDSHAGDISSGVKRMYKERFHLYIQCCIETDNNIVKSEVKRQKWFCKTVNKKDEIYDYICIYNEKYAC